MRPATVTFSLAFSLLAYGAVSSVQVGDPARQQGVVSFLVNDPSQCTVTVYQDVGLATKMDDTNNTLFAGSESCTRSYNIINGKQVTAIFGRRTSEQALDGKLHSRSLEVRHAYYVVITDLTDSTTASVSFTTANIPWGDTHIEEVPYSDTGYNHWAYPDLDWTDAGANKSYIDPISGVSFKRGPRQMVGSGGPDSYHVNAEFTFPAAFDVASAWSNAKNALSTSTSGPFASYAGAARASMYLPFAINTDDSKGIFSPYLDDGPHVDDIRVNVYGFAADTGNVEDRKVLVCLATQYNPSTDTCNTVEQEVILPTAAGSVQFPTTYPQFNFAGWSVGRALSQSEVTMHGAMHWGYAQVTNSAVVLNVFYLPFYAAPGMKIQIGGTWYTIGSIQDASHFTLVESSVTLSGNQQWYLAAFGIRVRKKTTANNQINVAATYSVAYSSGVAMPFNGVPEFCSPLTVSVGYAADGTTVLNPPKTGRLCYNKSFLFLLTDDGETRYLSSLSHTDYSYTGTGPSIPYGSFSQTDPYTLLGMHTDDTTAGKSTAYRAFYEITYDPTTCHFRTWPGNNYDVSSTQLSDCVTWTNKTPYTQHMTITEQIMAAVASNPIWDSSFNARDWFGLVDVNGRWANLAALTSNQDNPCVNVVFDLSTYTLVKAFDFMSGSLPGYRWGGCHGIGMSIAPSSNYAAAGISNLTARNGQGYLSGPFMLQGVTAKSLDGGTTWNTDTSIAGGTLINTATSAGKCGPQPWVVGSQCVDLTNVATTCSANSYGYSGYRCIKLKISSDVPCNIYSNSGLDSTKWPCPWHTGYAAGPGQMTIQPGDYISQSTDPSDITKIYFNGKGEKMRVLSKTTDTTGNFILELARWTTCDNPTSDPNGNPPTVTYYDHLYNGGATYPTGWNAAMVATGSCAGTLAWINLDKPLAQTDFAVDNTQLTTSHNTFGQAPDGTSLLQVGPGASRAGTIPAMAGIAPQYNWANSSSFFSGLQRASAGEVEAYPSLGNWAAKTRAQLGRAWDFRHLNPDTGTTSEVLNTIFPNTFTLVSGQTYTYKVSIYGDLGSFKARPANVFSTLSGFKNISSPATGNVIDDTKLNTWCQAYKANECRQGSSVGDVFVVAKNAYVGPNACVSDTYKTYAPCVTPLWSNAGWMIENDSQRDDPLGWRFRRITMGLVAPSAQYQYTSPHMSPDGAFAFVRAGYPNGVRADALTYKVPPPAVDDTVDRANFVPVVVVLPATSGYARIRFGYAENGAANQFYCTSRQEACLTDGQLTPFAYEQTDTLTATSCTAGCNISIPALSGRVLYYRVEKSADGTTGWVSGSTQVRAVK